MSSVIKISFIITVLCYSVAGTAAEEVCGLQSSECQETNTNWDFLVFSQQWPQTTCQIWKDQSSKHQCDIPTVVDSWTVHGIWPSVSKGSDPAFCNNTWAFNITELQPLIPELETYWPNVYLGTSQDDFWKHEWTKHGTCAASDSYIEGEYNYFHAGLKLVKKYNLNEILNNMGIIPTLEESYKLSDFHSAIISSLGVNGTIACYNEKEDKQHWIKEIRICLNKNLHAIKCPNELRISLEADQSCPNDGVLFYPPIQPTILSLPDNLERIEL